MTMGVNRYFIFVTCLATLTQGATISATVDSTESEVTTTESVSLTACGDKKDNCFQFGDEQCIGRYAPWAKANCAYRCGYCEGNFPPCKDQITYCSQLGAGACDDKIYQGFIRLNCRKTCNKCTVPALHMTPVTGSIIQPTDKPGQVVPTKATDNHMVPTVSPNTTDDCNDKKDNCFMYDDIKCIGIYEPWARDNCPYRCGYCPGKKPPCEDKIAYCNEYGNNICTDKSYAGWTRTNCRKYCNKCDVPYHGNNTVIQTTRSTPSQTNYVTSLNVQTSKTVPQKVTPVLPTGQACRDMRPDCADYDQEACTGVFKSWAMTNCARRCGYCNDGVQACRDYENCAHLPKNICTAEEYKEIAITACRRFCGFCKDEVKTTSPVSMLTTSSQSMSKASTSQNAATTSSQGMNKASTSRNAATTPSQSMSKASTSQNAATTSRKSTARPTSNQPLSSTTTLATTTQDSPTKPIVSTVQNTVSKMIPTKQPNTALPSKIFISTIHETMSTKMPTQQPVTTLPLTPTNKIPTKLSTAENLISKPSKPNQYTEGSTMQQKTSQNNSSPSQPQLSTSKQSSTMTPTKQKIATSMRIPVKPVTSGKVSEVPTPRLPDPSKGQPTPSPLNPDVSRGGPTPSPTLPTFGLSTNSPTVCSQNFTEPNPKCCRVCACPGEEVFGRVLNEVGEPIAKAQVYFSGCNCVRYLTDPSGNYAIQNICVKGHEMNFEAAGYLSSIVLPVSVVQGGRFWKANNILNPKPFIPGLNVTEAPKKN